MKTLEKKVHFTAEGTSIGCYYSKGNPIRFILINGKPFIELDKSVDRLLNIETATAHNTEPVYYDSNRSDSIAQVRLVGVLNNAFVSSKNSHWKYAERACTNRELASFHLAMYKAYKNAVKLEVKNG